MGTTEIQPTPPPPGQQPPWNPHWYGNLAQWVAPAVTLIIGIISVSLLVHYRNVDSSAKSSDEHINSLIDSRLNPAVQAINDNIDKKLVPVLSQLTDLAARVGRLEGRFEQLDAVQKRLTKLQLDKLSAQITSARQNKTIIDPATIERLGENVQAFVDDREPQISASAWHAFIQLADYRTTLNQGVAQPLVTAATRTQPNWGIQVKVLDPKIMVFGISYDGNRLVPFQQAARYEPMEPLTGPFEPQQHGPEFFVVSGRGVELILDGFRLKNVVIHDMQVSYDGGPLTMENVYFVNCTFVINKKPLVERFAQNVIASVPTSFKAG